MREGVKHCEINGEPAYVEQTGYKPGDRIQPWCARCYPGGTTADLVFAYGDTEQEAKDALSKKLTEREAQQKGTEL